MRLKRPNILEYQWATGTAVATGDAKSPKFRRYSSKVPKSDFNDTACSLLGFLIDRPMSGWDLAEMVTRTAGNFWHVTRSQIYRELRTLEEHGLVKGGEKGSRSRRVFEITPAGRKVFEGWIGREPGEYIGRVPLLMTVWFGDHVPSDDYDLYLRLHRNKHQKKAEFFQEIYDALPDKSAPMARALRFGLMFEQTFLAWFDTLPQFGGSEEIQWPAPPRPEEPKPFDDDPLAAPPGAYARSKGKGRK